MSFEDDGGFKGEVQCEWSWSVISASVTYSSALDRRLEMQMTILIQTVGVPLGTCHDPKFDSTGVKLEMDSRLAERATVDREEFIPKLFRIVYPVIQNHLLGGFDDVHDANSIIDTILSD